MSSVLVRQVESSSRLRFGKARVLKPKSMQDDEAVDVDVTAPTNELRVAAGTNEEVTVRVIKGQRCATSQPPTRTPAGCTLRECVPRRRE